MSKFYREYFSSNELDANDVSMQIEKCIELIENSKYKDVLIMLFDIESIKDENIILPGIKKLVNSVIAKDKRYKKIDAQYHLSKVFFSDNIDSNSVKLKFETSFENEEDIEEACTVYNTRRDYFENVYKMEKFANFCISNGHYDVLKSNILDLNERYEDDESLMRNFRFLQDSDGSYYIRAITSTNRYFDYNIRFSLFVTLIAIHNLIQNKNFQFRINRCEYDESFIRLYLEKEPTRIVPGLGKLKFILEMSNDEIKREAFKFYGVFLLSIQADDKEINVYLKPEKIKTHLISIKHSYLPETVIEYLKDLSTFINEAEKEMIDDLVDISKIENPDQIRYMLQRKVELSKNPEITKFKKAIKETLDTKIYKLSELISLMEKVDAIVSDLEVKEYLRYMFYDILRDKKKN